MEYLPDNHHASRSLQLIHTESLKDAFNKIGGSSLDLHAQQDAVEVFEILLGELTGPSIVSSAALTSKASPVSSATLVINLKEQTTSYLYFVSLSSKIFQTSLRVLETESLIESNV